VPRANRVQDPELGVSFCATVLGAGPIMENVRLKTTISDGDNGIQYEAHSVNEKPVSALRVFGC
jgi:hypothetical protein